MRGCIQFFFICLALANPFMRNQSKMTKYTCELREQGIIVKMFSYRGCSFNVDKEYMIIRVGHGWKGYGLYMREVSGDIAFLKNLICIRSLP